MPSLVVVEVEGPIAVVTISREKQLNALSSAVLGELIEIAGLLEDNRALHCVLVTGAGEKAFVAGADIAEM